MTRSQGPVGIHSTGVSAWERWPASMSTVSDRWQAGQVVVARPWHRGRWEWRQRRRRTRCAGWLADGEGMRCGTAGEAVRAHKQLAVAFQPAVLLEPGDRVRDTQGFTARCLGDIGNPRGSAREERRGRVALEGGDRALHVCGGTAPRGVGHSCRPSGSVADEGAVASGFAIGTVGRPRRRGRASRRRGWPSTPGGPSVAEIGGARGQPCSATAQLPRSRADSPAALR